jgi:hypothetical protein
VFCIWKFGVKLARNSPPIALCQSYPTDVASSALRRLVFAPVEPTKVDPDIPLLLLLSFAPTGPEVTGPG